MPRLRDLYTRPHSLSVAAVAAMVVLSFLLLTRASVSFYGFLLPIGAVTVLTIIVLIYSLLRPKPGIPEFAGYAAMWIAFTTAGCIQTYIASSISGPFMDSRFVAWDRAIGFDWVAWTDWVHSHAVLTLALRIAYFTLMAQIVVSLAIFALGRYNDRNEELLVSAALAAMATSLFSGLWPAIGPWVYFGSGASTTLDTVYAAHVTTMHLGGMHSFKLAEMQGIVCFPSYHTVLAILFTYAHRRIFWTFPPVLALNSIMLFSLPSEGGHYLADVWGGALVAVFAILATRWVMRVRNCTALPIFFREPRGTRAAV